MSDTTDAIAAPDEQEVWRDIPEWEGLYQASSEGRIRSLVRKGARRIYGGRVLRPHTSTQGYERVTLCRVNTQVTKIVSILVCAAFHGPRPSPEMQAAHGDGVRNHNRPTNLRWATPAENDTDKDSHGTRLVGARCAQSKLTPEVAIEIYLTPGNMAETARRFGIDRALVRRIKRRERWAHATAIVWRLVAREA